MEDIMCTGLAYLLYMIRGRLVGSRLQTSQRFRAVHLEIMPRFRTGSSKRGLCSVILVEGYRLSDGVLPYHFGRLPLCCSDHNSSAVAILIVDLTS